MNRHPLRSPCLALGLLAALALALLTPTPAAALCPKSEILETMFTKVCWSCLFPFKLGGKTLITRGMDELPATPENQLGTFCHCDDSLKPGVTASYSEPIRLIEVVRENYCFLTLNGLSMNGEHLERGGVYDTPEDGSVKKSAFYNVHYLSFPVWSIIGLTTTIMGKSINNMTSGFFPDISKCFLKDGFDVMDYTALYMSELDPTWSDDELGLLINPEAILFANPISQAVCAADCVAASSGYPLDPLFWCAGCWGNLTPWSGTYPGPVGELNTASLLAARTLARLHRTYFEGLTSTKLALCGKKYTGMIKKSQYRMQLIYPIPTTTPPLCCTPIGRSTTIWGNATTYPITGEDFAFLVWRQRDCCAR